MEERGAKKKVSITKNTRRRDVTSRCQYVCVWWGESDGRSDRRRREKERLIISANIYPCVIFSSSKIADLSLRRWSSSSHTHTHIVDRYQYKVGARWLKFYPRAQGGACCDFFSLARESCQDQVCDFRVGFVSWGLVTEKKCDKEGWSRRCEKWRVAPVSRPPKYALSLFLLSRLAGCWSSTVIFPSFLLFLLLFWGGRTARDREREREK